MKRLISTAIISTVILIASYTYTTENNTYVIIHNKSTWNIEVNFTKNNKTLRRVVRSGDLPAIIGKAGNITNISIKTYGQIYGYFAQPYTVSPATFNGYDTLININATYTSWQITRSAVTFKPEIPGQILDVYDAFPAAQKLMRTKKHTTAQAYRYILGLPDSPTREEAIDAYNNLKNTWSRDDWNRKEQSVAEKILTIIEEAKNYLLTAS